MLSVGIWVSFPAQALADCTYSGSLSWGGNCGATVNQTVTEGGAYSVNNTNAGYQGATTYFCLQGQFVKTGSDTCYVAGTGECVNVIGSDLRWNVFGNQCGAIWGSREKWVSGESHVVTNTMPGMTGSATYTCDNGSFSAPTGMSCAPGGGSGGGSSSSGGGSSSSSGGGGGSSSSSGGGDQPPACIPNGYCSAASICWDTICTTNCGQQVIGTMICGPTIKSFTVDRNILSAQGPVTLKWDVAAVTQCVASGGWKGNVSTKGGTFTKKISEATVFYLECFNDAGKSSGKKEVQVTFGPTITSFTSDVVTLSKPGPVTLKWTTSSVSTCTASGGWGGSITPLTNGTSVQSVTDPTTTFYLECFGPSGVSSGERQIKVKIDPGTCTPNNTCADLICSGATCSDGCGGEINGKIDCSKGACTPDNSCATDRCTYDSCFNNCGEEIQGTKTCDTLSSNAQCATGSTCQSGTSCAGGKQKVGSCNGGLDSCCMTGGTRVDSGGLPGSSDTQAGLINITNPLDFDTVEGLLNSILGFLQGIIAILSLIMIVIGSLIYMTAAGDDKKLGTGKMIITASLVGLALALAAPSFLKQIGEILGWGTTDSSDVAGAKTILEILQTALNFLLSVVGIIAIIMLVVGGLMYLLSAGDEDRMKTGKTIVIYSLIGIAVALSALVLVTQVVRLFG